MNHAPLASRTAHLAGRLAERALDRLVVVAIAVGLAAALGGCGVSVEPLEAFDVVIVPAVDCTRNASSQQCVEPDVLAEQRLKARWVLEHAADSTFSLTDHQGTTMTGVTFGDDGQVPNLDQIVDGQPCQGEGGLCYFARRRFESTDDGDNGCTHFGQVVALLRRLPDGTFTGRVSDLQGTDEDCGTSTIVERVQDVTGTLSAEPALAREEAAP